MFFCKYKYSKITIKLSPHYPFPDFRDTANKDRQNRYCNECAKCREDNLKRGCPHSENSCLTDSKPSAEKPREQHQDNHVGKIHSIARL